MKKYNKKTKNATRPATAFTYIDLLFRCLASFLYFCDNIDKFWVFESNSAKYKYFSIFLLVDFYISSFLHKQNSSMLPESTVPLCKTSSIFCTMILCTSCNWLLSVFKFLRDLLSIKIFLAF